MADLEFLYIGDPMCSWCWGFSPVLDKLESTFGLPLQTRVGGLRPGSSAQAVDDKLQGVLAHHWHEVAKASGQPFDHAILDRRDWRYDTELPCIAVVTMRELQPAQTQPFFARLHRAFYAEGIDITVPEAYPALVADFVPDVDAFMAALGSPAMKAAAWAEFKWAHDLGVRGFPTLFLRDGNELIPITQGYMPLERFEIPLRTWLDKRLAAEAEELALQGDACAIDGEDC